MAEKCQKLEEVNTKLQKRVEELEAALLSTGIVILLNTINENKINNFMKLLRFVLFKYMYNHKIIRY